MSPKTMPGGILIERKSQVGSRPFLVVASMMIGVVVSTFSLVGYAGKYFFVDRTEYSQTLLKGADSDGETKKTLLRVETILAQQEAALDRQEKAFDRLSEIVRGLELGAEEERKVTDDPDDDTAPVVVRDGSLTELRTLLLEPGATGEIYVAPDPAMPASVLFVTCRPVGASVSATVEHRGIVLADREPVQHLRHGVPVREPADEESPVKITLTSNDVGQARVDVNLVGGEERG